MEDKKLAKKLEKKKAREEMLIRIRKETLTREEAMDEANLRKIRDRWFDSIVESKIPQMQDNLKHILHYMERLIEAESYRKNLFEEDREELDEESTLLAQGHSSAMDRLFDIYKKRVEDMQNAYNELVVYKKAEAEAEFNVIEEREGETQENMQTMLYQMQDDREKEEDAMNCSMFLKLDDERSKNTELKESLRLRLENKMEKRWGEISATLNKYEEKTKERRKEYMALKTKDDADSKLIFQQMKKTQKLFEQLDVLKKCMDECYAPKETITLIKDTMEERTKFFNTFQQLRAMLQDEVNQDQLNLKVLTVITNRVIKEMKEICKKGERVLMLYRVCLTLETEKEKVQPVGDFNIPKGLGTVEGRRRTKTPREEPLNPKDSETRTETWTRDLEVLGRFWKKVAQARLSKLALKKCIENLKRENNILTKILTAYLKNFSENR